MEEELNENELEERLYAMLHHVDETQKDVTVTIQNENNGSDIAENGPRGTIRRYWRTGSEYNRYQKVNTPKESPVVTNNIVSQQNNIKSKDDQPSSADQVDLTLLQSPIPQNLKSTIEIIEHEEINHFDLETSDEDEVVEVAMPPKPTITIESSDDEIEIVKPASPVPQAKNKSTDERGNSTSPVPSVVSSVSDEFIRGDCIALKISSRQPQEKPSFDFSLHGSDLMQDTPTKKKKKKKSKEAAISTPINSQNNSAVDRSSTDACFATPKSKARNRKQKSKSFTVANKNVPNADVYDSDSNHSIISSNMNKSHYTVTETSLPSTDVYESDSNQSEVAKDPHIEVSRYDIVDSTSPISSPINETTVPIDTQEKTMSFVDLTENNDFVTMDSTDICESIVMGNVTGFTEPDNYSDENQPPSLNNDFSKYVSSKVPSILFEDLDFDNLKGKDRFCKRRRYSLKTLRIEMEKFYNESWGGEDFNHKEIQKNMSRDKSLWAIDPKDKMATSAQRKQKCGYCGRMGHRDETCYSKPPICHMCGNMGHMEPRCPRKICFNCGTPNHNYTNMCRNCASWGKMRCNECGQTGHPATHCPDIWRRYHNTIELNMPLERISQSRSYNSMYCSGCSRRGHLIHSCRTTIPFSGLPINSPYVFVYRPIYGQITQYKNMFDPDFTISSPATPQRDRNKRQSKSPTIHETHLNKKRAMSESDTRFSKSPVNTVKNTPQKENHQDNKSQKTPNKPVQNQTTDSAIAKTPEYIPVSSSNHNEKGQMIQDNEVSDTSDVVTSARIYVTNDLIDKLKTKEGSEWLAAITKKLEVTVETTDITSFLTIKGKIADQETFQIELREWSQQSSKSENPKGDKKINEQNQLNTNIPKNKFSTLKFLNNALNSLNTTIGDPRSIYKELTFSQNRHQKLMKQKVINPRVLEHSRGHINEVLKKLNMLLLGQAGLADGPKRIKELFSLKEKVAKVFTKNIPMDLRLEIDEHYNNIFGSIERNDYVDLLNKYYVRKYPTSPKKRKKLFNINVVPYKKSIPTTKNINNQQENNLNKPTQNVQNNGFKQQNIAKSKPPSVSDDSNYQKAMQIDQLKLFHKQLLKAQPCEISHKKARVYLIRRLHTLISSLLGREKVPSKMRKKLKKTQQDAQNLLKNM